MKCKKCDGKGYTDSELNCPACNGMGTVQWWETQEYRETGNRPKVEKPDKDKFSNDLGMVGGIVIGVIIYVFTANSMIAVITGALTAVLGATLLRFIFKYIFAILVISYVIYLLFG